VDSGEQREEEPGGRAVDVERAYQPSVSASSAVQGGKQTLTRPLEESCKISDHETIGQSVQATGKFQGRAGES